MGRPHTALLEFFFQAPMRISVGGGHRGLRLAEKTLWYRRTYTHCRSSHGPNRTRARRGVGLPPPHSCWIYLKIFCWSPALYTRKSPGLFCGRRPQKTMTRVASSRELLHQSSTLIEVDDAGAIGSAARCLMHVLFDLRAEDLQNVISGSLFFKRTTTQTASARR